MGPPFFFWKWVRVLPVEVQAAMKWPGDQKPKTFSQIRQRQSEYYYNISISISHVGYYYYIGYFCLQLCHLTILCIYIHNTFVS